MAYIYVVNKNEFVNKDQTEKLLTQINLSDIKEQNSAVGKIIVSYAISKYYNIPSSDLIFSKTELGKPFLKNHPNIHFNISHSGDMVACIIADYPVGIDIQKIRSYNQKIAERVCNEKEFKKIENSSDKSLEFIKIWTQKEAVIKRDGKSIAGNIKNVLENQNVFSQRINNYWISFTF